MQQVLIAFYTSLPYLVAVGAAVMLIAIGLTVSTRPVLLTLLYMAFLYWVPEITYGQLDASAGSMYSKGAGILVFPAMFWGVLAAIAWLRLSDRLAAQPVFRTGPTLAPWFAAWALLLLMHVGYAFFVDQPFRDAVGPSGFSNIVWMGLFAAFVCATVRSERDIQWLLRFMLVIGVARAIFGLVRWAAFGGDPANAYANRHGLSLKLTFFDVYDSLVCMLAICVATQWLFPKHGQAVKHPLLRGALWLGLVLAAGCIVLSFRRTAAIGMLIAGVFLLFQLSSSGRRQLLLAGAPAALGAVLYTVWKRLSQTKHAGGLADLFFDITPAKVGPDSPRLTELKLSWQSFIESPVFGVGSWGHYDHWQLVSWQLYEGGGGSYLHSGVLHIGLKSGLVGLMLFIGIVWSFIHYWRRVKSRLTGQARVLAVAGVAGALFIVPDFIIGTSLTKYRAILFIGLCLALPYAAAAVQRIRVERASSASGLLMPTRGTDIGAVARTAR